MIIEMSGHSSRIHWRLFALVISISLFTSLGLPPFFNLFFLYSSCNLVTASSYSSSEISSWSPSDTLARFSDGPGCSSDGSCLVQFLLKFLKEFRSPSFQDPYVQKFTSIHFLTSNNLHKNFFLRHLQV